MQNTKASAISFCKVHQPPRGWAAGNIPEAEVVFTVTMIVWLELAPLAVSVMGLAGLKLHVAPVGKPEHARATFPAKPPTDVIVNDVIPESPGAATVTVGLDDAR